MPGDPLDPSTTASQHTPRQMTDDVTGNVGGFSRYVAFAIALLLAIILFGWAPFKLTAWSAAEHDAGAAQTPGQDPLGMLAVCLAALTVLVGARWCLFFVLAFVAHERHRRRRPPTSGDMPLVSILVPAYNEGETIGPALRSLLEVDYPRFEVVVVDDGSTDQTFARASLFEGRQGHCEVRVHRKLNGGKWSALNFAFQRSIGELVLCVDADSRLDPQSLGLMVAHMVDPAVTAVAGQVRVRNRINLITRLQGLEYVIANGLVRMAQSLMGTVLVVPGPIGLFRRAAMEEVYIRFGSSCRGIEDAEDDCGSSSLRQWKPADIEGPFEGDTFAEDFDLSLALLALGGRCVYEPHAISHTKAPDWPMALLNQRYRWCRGTIQVIRKFTRRCRTQPQLMQPRLLFWVGLTYLLELVVLPLANLAAMVLVALFVAGGGNLLPLAGWAAAFMLLNLNAAAVFVAAHNERLGTLAVLPFYDAYHGFLLNSGWAVAVVDEVFGRRMRW
jgi:poly-beta-1,6-N-acetyl-D-glucosamine synthase